MIIHTGLVKSTFVDHNDDYDGGDNDDGDNYMANSNSACDAGRQ